MKHLLSIILAMGGLLSMTASAQNLVPEPIQVDDQAWISPPTLPGLKARWLVGAEQRPAPYLIRVQLLNGTRVPPHSHPDERNTSVLKGTLYVGFGDSFDEQKLVAIPNGAVYIAPADTPHYLWAKDGDVLYQEAGSGPTGTGFSSR